MFVKGHPNYYSKKYLGDKFDEIERIRKLRIGATVKRKGLVENMHTGEARIKAEKTKKQRYPNAEYCHGGKAGKKRSKSLIKFYLDHPETKEVHRRNFIKNILETNKHNSGLPEDFVLSDKSKKQISNTLKETYKKNPELIEANRQRRLNIIYPKKRTSIELKIQKVLNELNINFIENYSFSSLGIVTHMDMAIPEKKIAIYCDGDYWHNLPDYIKRDSRITKTLKDNGWRVLRFWEHDINKDAQKCAKQILAEIEL